MAQRCEYSNLVLPNDRSYVPVARAYVREVSKRLGFERPELENIEKALAQAVENVIEHAFEPYEKETFEISCERVPEGLKVIVKDKGLPFDSSQVPDSGEPGGRATGQELGQGFFVMRELMDEVSVHNLGLDGKEVHLVKYLKNKSVDDYIEACELEPYEPPSSIRLFPEKKISFQIRLMEPADAVEVAKCAYKAYGYSYFYPQIYYPDRMIELNESGRVISAVALTESGDLAGHCSLFRSHNASPIAEVGQAVVKPEYRGHGCLIQLTEFLIDEAESRELTGLYVRAVTSHTFSQRVADRLGFRNCAIMLAYAPASVSFKGISERLAQRETFSVYYRYITKPEGLILYPPAQHRDFIAKLYDNLGVVPNFADPGECSQDLPYFRSVIETKAAVFEPEALATIEVKRYGKNVVSEVRAKLKELCLKHYDVIELYLDLADPHTCGLTAEFERLGFFFGGIVPGASGRDTFMLQYLNNLAVDYERIKLHSKMGRETLAYVKQHDPYVRERLEA